MELQRDYDSPLKGENCFKSWKIGQALPLEYAVSMRIHRPKSSLLCWRAWLFWETVQWKWLGPQTRGHEKACVMGWYRESCAWRPAWEGVLQLRCSARSGRVGPKGSRPANGEGGRQGRKLRASSACLSRRLSWYAGAQEVSLASWHKLLRLFW